MFSIRRFDLLLSIYIFCICTSELMGGKTFPLLAHPLTLNASVGIFVVPLVYGINDVFTEVYGKQRTRGIVRAGLIVVFLIFFYAMLATHLPPSPRFTAIEPAYDAIFMQSARIAFASLTAFAIAEFTDIFVFARIRNRMNGRALWLRTNVANILAQFLDTTIFIVLAFYAIDKTPASNIVFLWSLILPYWLIKCVVSAIETPLVYAGVAWLKNDPRYQESA